jgi:oxygen-dependent protoporphyrinogen oxidase
VPSREHRDILGVLFLSAFLKDRAPKGGALLSVFLGGVRNQDMVNLKDEEIKKLVFPELQKMMMVPDKEPDLFRIFRHTHAIPQYGISTGERLNAVEEIQKHFPGLLLGGNLRDGIGMADRIKQGTSFLKKTATPKILTPNMIKQNQKNSLIFLHKRFCDFNKTPNFATALREKHTVSQT